MNGKPVTWCYHGCVDGFLNTVMRLPVVEDPSQLSIPAGGRLEVVQALNAKARVIGPIPMEGTTLGELPAGTSGINVFVRFEAGSASYYWRVP